MKIRGIIGIILLAVGIFLVMQLVVQNFVVKGPSMEPSLYTGQMFLVNKVVYRLHPPQRGDIIVFRSPVPPPPIVIKRVIGKPGDTIEINAGKVYINGHLLEEPYIMEAPSYSYGPETVPTDHYFLLGDNRNESGDSHDLFGPVPEENIIGKAWLCIWPISEWRLAPHCPLEVSE